MAQHRQKTKKYDIKEYNIQNCCCQRRYRNSTKEFLAQTKYRSYGIYVEIIISINLTLFPWHIVSANAVFIAYFYGSKLNIL